jgi:hypothetical protein
MRDVVPHVLPPPFPFYKPASTHCLLFPVLLGLPRVAVMKAPTIDRQTTSPRPLYSLSFTLLKEANSPAFHFHRQLNSAPPSNKSVGGEHPGNLM